MRSDQLLFLTDDRMRSGVELMFFAYRDMTADPDKVLAQRGLGRAHHRALHFVRHREGITVAELIDLLGVTKQSLNRVLRKLIEDGIIYQEVGESDRRQRRLYLSDEGKALEKSLAAMQRERLRKAFQKAGPDAVAGFREVLAQMMDEGSRNYLADMADTQ
ncbi:MAG: MarR family winged helix-turn-helix transcriptional regulator [Pikeienuella sp.]